MHLQLFRTTIVAGLACFGTSLLAQPTASKPEVPQTTVDQTFQGVRESVNNAIQSGANQLRAAGNQVSPYDQQQNAQQQNAQQQNAQQQNAQQQNAQQQYSQQQNGQPQYGQQRTGQQQYSQQNNQNPSNQQWQTPGTAPHGMSSNGVNNLSSSNAQQNHWPAHSSQRVYMLRYDAAGREFICVNGSPVYFDASPSRSPTGMPPAPNAQGGQRSSEYGTFDAPAGQANRQQNGSFNNNQGQGDINQANQGNINRRTNNQGSATTGEAARSLATPPTDVPSPSDPSTSGDDLDDGSDFQF